MCIYRGVASTQSTATRLDWQALFSSPPLPWMRLGIFVPLGGQGSAPETDLTGIINDFHAEVPPWQPGRDTKGGSVQLTISMRSLEGVH
jgi:hypothetical protein